MPLNIECKKTWTRFDKYGMPVTKDDPESIDNCVGTLVCMGFCYGFIKEFKEALEQCLIKEPGKKHVLIRHPTRPIPTSRDHWSYFIQYRKWTNRNPQRFKNFIKYVPRMNGLNLWMKALTGSKIHEWLYYTLYIPGARLGNWWNRLIMRIGKAGPERTNEWWITRPEGGATNGELLQRSFTRWQKFWLHGPRFKLFGKECHIEILVPAYPLHNKGWQLYVMPKSKRKETLKRILLQRVEKSNIMLRLLFGDTTVTQEEVDNCPHMTGYRPGVYYPTCDRTIRELTPEEAEFNAYEKDLIIWLYESNI